MYSLFIFSYLPDKTCDETGTNIDGKLHWVHNVSNGSYTYMTVSKKRGYEGIKSTGVLPDYHGIQSCRYEHL